MTTLHARALPVFLFLLLAGPPAQAADTAVQPTAPLAAPAGSAEAPEPETETVAVAPSDIVGLVIGTEGKAMIQREDSPPSPASFKTPLRMGDTIATAGDARLFLRLIDGTDVTLGPMASLSVRNFSFDPEDAQRNTALLALSGPFRVKSGGFQPGDDLTLTLPVARIALREASLVAGAVDDDYALAIEGETGSASALFTRGRVTLNAGQGTEISGKTAIPTRPQPLSPERLDALDSQVTLKDQAEYDQRIVGMEKIFSHLLAAHHALLAEETDRGRSVTGRRHDNPVSRASAQPQGDGTSATLSDDGSKKFAAPAQPQPQPATSTTESELPAKPAPSTPDAL